MPAFQSGLLANVLARQRGLRDNVPKACQLLIFTYHSANKHANVLKGIPMFQLGVQTYETNFATWCVNVPKGELIYQT